MEKNVKDITQMLTAKKTKKKKKRWNHRLWALVADQSTDK